MGVFSARCHGAVGGGLLVAVLLSISASVSALPKGNRGEPPPLRLGDIAPQDTPEPAPDDPVDVALKNSPMPPAAAAGARPQGAAESAVTCRAEQKPGQSEAQVVCSDGKSWTLRSAGLVLPTVQHCSSAHPECCEIGYRNPRELQIADLIRFGQGEAPICHVKAESVVTNPPVSAAPPPVPIDEEEDGPPRPPSLPPLGIPSGKGGRCPSGFYLVLDRCYDPRELMRALRPLAIDDPNQPLFPEFAAASLRLRREFDATAHCPRASLDIEGLERFAERIAERSRQRADSAGAAGLYVTPLLARAQAPGGAQMEPQLPIACNYNPEAQVFEETSFHCATNNVCFAQTRPSLPHTCVRFDRATAQGQNSPSFFPVADCLNLPSCFAVPGRQCIGVARLSALGSGVFLITQENARNERNAIGVLFARKRPRTPAERERAQLARSLLYQIGRNYLSDVERARLDTLLSSQPE